MNTRNGISNNIDAFSSMRCCLCASFTRLLLAVFLTLLPLPASAEHDLILVFDEGVENCVEGGQSSASAGGCEYEEKTVASIFSGSYFWADIVLVNGTPDPGELKAMAVGPDGGVFFGDEQLADGSHAGLPEFLGGPSGPEDPSIDMPWYFQSNTGMFYTQVTAVHGGISPRGDPVSFFTNPDPGPGSVNFTSWRMTYAGAFFDLGGDITQGDTGSATITCSPAPCVNGSTFSLDYVAHLPSGSPLGFQFFQVSIHLEGTVAVANDPPVAFDDPNISTLEETAVTVNVVANDTDPDGNLDPASANTVCTTCSVPGGGTLQNNGDGTFTYTPNIGFSGDDTFVYEVCDTEPLCDTATVTISVNDRPEVDLDTGTSGNNYLTSWTEGGGNINIAATTEITDLVGAGIVRATVTLTNAKPDDVLSEPSLPANIEPPEMAASNDFQRIYNSNAGPLAFSIFQGIIESVQFDNPTGFPDLADRIVAITVTDDLNSTSLPALSTITINAVDEPPVLDLNGTDSDIHWTTSFIANNGSIAIADGDATLVDDDSASMNGAIVTVTNVMPGDALSVTNLPGTINASGAGTGTLTLSNLASKADYLTALKGVRFNSSMAAPDTTPRSITAMVTDNTGLSNAPLATTTVNITETPVVDLDGNDSSGATGLDFNTRFTVGAVPPDRAVSISDTDTTITDDSTDLSGVTVTLVNPKNNDSLSVVGTLPGGGAIADVTPVSSNTTVVLSGTASKTDYAAAIGFIKFDNLSSIPDTAPRFVTVVATDDTGFRGSTAISTIGIDTDFAVTFEDIPEIVLTADNLSYTITVTNLNMAQATDVVLTDTLPEGVIFTGATGTDWDCNEFQAGGNSTIICTRTTLDSGASSTVTIDIVTPAESGTITNTVVVSNSDPLFGTGGGIQETLAVDFNVHGFDDQQVPAGGSSDLTSPSPVAIAGDVMVVGDPSDTAPGRVFILQDKSVQGVSDPGVGDWIEIAPIPSPSAVNGDRFGYSVAFDGTWLVVGAPGGNEAWVIDTLTFNPVQLVPGVPPVSGFGTAVALDGDTIVVGSPDGGAAGRGMVHVFTWDGTTWSESQAIDAEVLSGSPTSSLWHFGESVALQDGTLAIGAPSDGAQLLPGRTFIYTENPGAWELTQELVNPDNDFMDRFGWSMNLDGNTLVVGAILNPTGGLDSGAAHVYTRSGGVWTHLQRISNPEPLGDEQFSFSLSLQGDTLVAGAPFARSIEAGSLQSGSTYIFQRSGGVFVLQQKRSDDFATEGDEFGTAVALDGTTLAVIAPNRFASGGGGVPSEILIYTLDVDTPDIKLTAPTPVAGAHFGHAVDISADTVVIGAPDDIGNQGMEEDGAVYIYQRDVYGDWLLQQTLTATGLYDFTSKFGNAVAIDGNTLVVGAPFEDGGIIDDNNYGAVYVYVYDLFDDSKWGLQQVLQADAPTQEDYFGHAVAIDGANIVVGAPGHEIDAPTNNRGAVYVFHFNGSTWQQEGDGTDNFLVGGASGNANALGTSVAISGDTLAASGAGGSSKEVYVFVRQTPIPVWYEQAQITVTGASNGLAVALDGNRLAIGDPRVSATPGVQTWTRSGDDWGLEEQLGSSDAPDPGNFGTSVALLGDVLLAGAPDADGVEDTSGAVYLFRRNATGPPVWEAKQKLVASDGETDDKFGGDDIEILLSTALLAQHAIALSRDARVVGAPFEDGGSINDDYGAAYVYPTGVVASPAGRVFGSNQLVTLTCTGCFDIYYTDDGSAVVEADGVTPTASAQLYISPIAIDDMNPVSGNTTTLRFFSVDDNVPANAESEQTLTFVIDKTSPTVSIDPLTNGEVNVSPLTTTPLTGCALDEAGGSGLQMVQIEIQDVETPLEYILNTDDSGQSRGMTQKWLTATLTVPGTGTCSGETSWSLPFSGVDHPLVEGHTYNVRVRAFDQVGNVSVIDTLSLGYYTLAKAFTTLNLNLSANSILNYPGLSEEGNGQIGASIKLTNPGNLNENLSGRLVTLEILDENGQPIPGSSPLQNLPTNDEGRITLQHLGDADASNWGQYLEPPVETGDGIAIDFVPEGIYTLQARFFGDLTHQAADSEPLSLLVGESAGSAVIVVGTANINEGMLSHNKTAKRIYDSLYARGFQEGDIRFLSPDTNRDGYVNQLDVDNCTPPPALDGDCLDLVGGTPNGIDGIPNLTPDPDKNDPNNVQTAIEGLAALSNANPAPRYVFLIDHGNPNQFLLNDTGETITPSDLDSWLDSQESQLDPLQGGTEPSVVILGMCYSGSFMDTVAVDDTNNPSPVDRVMITSASDDEESFRGLQEDDDVLVGEFFLEEFIKEAERGATLKAAFEYATEQTEIFTRRSDIAVPHVMFNDDAAQHPLLEDNRAFDPLDLAGNNALVDSTGADGELADELFLGIGLNYDYATNPDNFPVYIPVYIPADIVAVTETQYLPAGVSVAPMTLDAANNDGQVDSVWIEVRAPGISYTPTGATFQKTPQLVKMILNSPVSPESQVPYNSYWNYYLNFAAGKNEVFYVVEDVSRVISPIRRSVVYVNTTVNGFPNGLPTAPTLVSPLDDVETDTILVFDWNPSTDPESHPITYTLEIAILGPGDTVPDFDPEDIVYRKEEITKTYTFAGESAGLLNRMTYYWRVIAVDAFGGRGTSDPFKFTTNVTNADRGVVFATVNNAIDDPILEFANVTAVPSSGGAEVTPMASDYYPDGPGGTFYRKYPGGVYDITISGLEPYGFAPNTTGVNVSQDEKSYSTTLQSDDSDFDGLSDVDESAYGTDPGNPDTDNDWLSDGDEVHIYHTNPTNRDTDGDSFMDGIEIIAGTDPIDPGDLPPPDGDLAPRSVYNGIINVADYLLAQRMALGILAWTPEDLDHGDFNGNGSIDTSDLLLVLKKVMGIP